MTLDLHLSATLPVLAPLLAAVVVLLVDAALPGRRTPHLVLTGLGLVAGAVATVPGLRQPAGDARSAFCLGSGECLYTADRLTSVLQLAGLLAAVVVLVLAWRDWRAPSGTGRTAVVAALVLGATGGVVAVPAAGDLGSLLVALELATLPTVALVVLTDEAWSGERRARAVEGATALLMTSLVSFGLVALGAALWVAATGTALLELPTSRDPSLLLLASVFVLAGLAFKLSAVPFHAWTPITYSTASLPVTAYLSTVSKVAALGAVVVLVRALGAVDGTTLLALALLAALSMTVGNLVALVQTDAVRLLAWSTVAQAGWVLLPLASLSSRAVHAAGSYLVVYVLGTLLAFAVVVAVAGLVSVEGGTEADGTSLRAHDGLLRRRPLLAIPLVLALLTLAGLPPAVVGLVAKVVALRPVAGDGTWWLAVVAAVNVALGIAVYLRWIVRLVAPLPAGTVAPAPAGAVASTGMATGGVDEALEAESADGDVLVAARPRVPVPVLAVIGVLTLLVVLWSITPVGVV
ncbi:NADH-quinone oxidoreductase subunit N [Ornithinimicrobium humiphilum]|uniref:NADH dehydrogenase subunit N n=1 Tax=Ornithinimicrobium humiphilum TaxID=125288 RepID=A0A543KRD8_9MICO|nr:proton-conducting transporter membrane subunit [Ornithinimicrobium humiphilum]TQM97639.1 NADH dehydrogenase subunit N [Ornithinimicrobium humiphilum]